VPLTFYCTVCTNLETRVSADKVSFETQNIYVQKKFLGNFKSHEIQTKWLFKQIFSLKVMLTVAKGEGLGGSKFLEREAHHDITPYSFYTVGNGFEIVQTLAIIRLFMTLKSQQQRQLKSPSYC